MVSQGLRRGCDFMLKQSRVTRRPRREGKPAGETSSPLFLYAQRERADVLEVAGEHCTQKQRALLVLHYELGLSITEIAGHFGVSQPAAAYMHARALEELQRVLARMGIRDIGDLLP